MSSPDSDSPTFALVIASIIAVVAACSGPEPTGSAGNAPGLGVYIPLAWKTVRTVRGHAKHVLERHIPCSRCHELTPDSIGDVTPMRCAVCHEKEGAFQHAHREAQEKFGALATTNCMTCHAFTPNGSPGADAQSSVPAPAACARCHASKSNDAPQVAVHATSQCVSCHTPHENEGPRGGPCLDCHRDVRTAHATAGKTQSEICTTCHSHQHAPASDAIDTCATCHASHGSHAPIIPKTALFENGHTQCVACHRPHEFTAGGAVACKSCHGGIHVLGAPSVAEHARCESCHSPHDVRGSGDRVCASCHQNVHLDHPKTAGSCVGCHDPHPAAQSAPIARPCSSCHQLAASDHAFHGGTACPSCHVPHEFALTLGVQTNRELCERCHAKEVTLVATNPGHQQCQGCHRGLPHRPTKLEATCETCHAAEQRTAPPGHQTCLNCHDQHSGNQKVPCTGCHRSEAESVHGKIAGGCADCHRPHGPAGVASPPPCTSCHDSAKLPGLHAVDRHGQCKDCHSGHDDPQRPERAPCLACHTDRKNHFPEAPSCTSCHLFGPTR